MQTLDCEGTPLAPGDRVRAKDRGIDGETAIVMRAAWGPIISVRYDSTGQVYSSASTLWRKESEGRDMSLRGVESLCSSG